MIADGERPAVEMPHLCRPARGRGDPGGQAHTGVEHSSATFDAIVQLF